MRARMLFDRRPSMTATRKSGCAAARLRRGAASAGSSVRPNTPEPIHSVAATTMTTARMRLYIMTAPPESDEGREA